MTVQIIDLNDSSFNISINKPQCNKSGALNILTAKRCQPTFEIRAIASDCAPSLAY